jgi:Chitinase
MKKLIISLVAIGLIISSCDKDRYQPGPGGSGTEGGESTTTHVDKKDGRIVIGYCTYYGKLTPDPTLVTNINYAFAELYVRNGKYIGFELQGSEDRFKQVVNVKKEHPEIKISLSFSHTVSNSDNYQAGGFSVMASTEEGRKAFANDCLTFIQKWGIDGIDIDWEFPGLSWSGHACDPSIDTENYTLLMKQLRETLGSRYLLTYAGYVMDMQNVTGGHKFIDIAAVDPYVDFVNIMTYDIASGAEGQHQSAWNRPDYYWDCKRAIDAYINAGVKPEKLIIGIPFYARHAWDNSDGYKGCVDYKDFGTEYTTAKGFKIDNWDSKGEVPYITKDGRMWAGYDNPQSIELKAQKVIKMGMKGLMYWDYDADDNKGTLRNAVWNSVMKQ